MKRFAGFLILVLIPLGTAEPVYAHGYGAAAVQRFRVQRAFAPRYPVQQIQRVQKVQRVIVAPVLAAPAYAYPSVIQPAQAFQQGYGYQQQQQQFQFKQKQQFQQYQAPQFQAPQFQNGYYCP